MMETMFGVPQNAQEVLIDPWFLVARSALGIVTSMIAAWIPARSAARVEPVQALQKGRYQVLGAGENRVRRRCGAARGGDRAVCLVCSAGTGRRSTSGYLLTVIAGAAADAVPLAGTREAAAPAAEVAAAGGRRAGGRQPDSGAAPDVGHGRGADAVAGAGDRAGRRGARELRIHPGGWIGNAESGPVRIPPRETLSARDFRFPASMDSELEQVPGIDEVQPVRTPRVQYRGQPIMIVAVPIWRGRMPRRSSMQSRAIRRQ